jgi:hypothetical protein
MSLYNSEITGSAEMIWQPMDTAPKTGEVLLLYVRWYDLAGFELEKKYTGGEGPALGYFNARCGRWRLVDGTGDAEPTHWIHIPVHPREVPTCG